MWHHPALTPAGSLLSRHRSLSARADQAHTIVRRLQQLVPDLRIWLDVDYLDDVGKLEDAVADAAVMLVFLSVGYFESLNCRRELYAALGSNRPFIPVREADPAKGGASIAALMAECRENCVEAAPPAYPCYRGPEEMLARVFEKTPIVWVRVNAFQLESLKAIALRMLLHSPYYASRTAELAAGVTVPGEVVPVALSGPVTLLHCRDNEGAFELSEDQVGGEREAGARPGCQRRCSHNPRGGGGARQCGPGGPRRVHALPERQDLSGRRRRRRAPRTSGDGPAHRHRHGPRAGARPWRRSFPLLGSTHAAGAAAAAVHPLRHRGGATLSIGGAPQGELTPRALWHGSGALRRGVVPAAVAAPPTPNRGGAARACRTPHGGDSSYSATS